jgi:hypothetical protein
LAFGCGLSRCGKTVLVVAPFTLCSLVVSLQFPKVLVFLCGLRVLPCDSFAKPFRINTRSVRQRIAVGFQFWQFWHLWQFWQSPPSHSLFNPAKPVAGLCGERVLVVLNPPVTILLNRIVSIL